MTDALHHCLDRAAAALLAQRNAAGYWEGELASSPLGTAVALCALKDGELPRERAENAFAYLARTQNPDGGWGDTDRSKSNLAATLLVLCAIKLNPQSSIRIPQSDRERARKFVEKLGGLRDGLRRVYGKDLTFQVPIRMTAAIAGLLPWRDVDALPLELALAPRVLMGALRLPVVSYALPALVCVGLSRHAQAPSWFLPARWLRSAVADRALDTILKMQPASGGYLEASPITGFCILGLKAAGRGSHPVAQNATRFLLNTQRADGSWAVEVNLSVWNTTRAIDALAAGGLLGRLSEKERNTTRDWLLEQQTKTPSVYSDAQPGGWGWNHLSGSVPDADDTAGALIALRHLGVDSGDAISHGTMWLRYLQNPDGGWPTFCRGWNKLPFDRSAPDLTAHVVRAMWPSSNEPPTWLTGNPLPLGCSRRDVAVEFAWNRIRKFQRPDGSFAPLWFGCESADDHANATYGTVAVLLACENEARANAMRDELIATLRGKPGYESNISYILREANIQSKRASITRCALQYLRGIQNADGGFGGCAGAPSTAEETGLALRALVAHGGSLADDQCRRAAQWLIDRQKPDGTWEPAPIGFYFAVLWYYEKLYPLYYALGGLGALAQAGSSPLPLGERADVSAANAG